MNPKRLFEPHLVIRELLLPPAGEWMTSFPGWVVIHVTSGETYSLHAQKNQKLETGSVVALFCSSKGYIRASQLGKVSLHYFQVEPNRLTGLMGLDEARLLQKAAGEDKLPPRVMPPNHPVSEKFRKLCANPNGGGFSMRLQLLEIFTEALGLELKQPETESSREIGVKSRIADLVKQMPASVLLDLEFSQLVEQMHSSPRHVSRIFSEVVGMSFQEKKREVRMLRARELLSTTEAKILDVALESGYQSNSLFYSIFKRHFGVTPGKWREQLRSRRTTIKRPRRQEAQPA